MPALYRIVVSEESALDRVGGGSVVKDEILVRDLVFVLQRDGRLARTLAIDLDVMQDRLDVDDGCAGVKVDGQGDIRSASSSLGDEGRGLPFFSSQLTKRGERPRF